MSNYIDRSYAVDLTTVYEHYGRLMVMAGCMAVYGVNDHRLKGGV